MSKKIKMIFIDLFCGAGGVTTGIERAKDKKVKLAKVIACVNHDPIAIKSHAYNHKHVLHFVEDIRTLDLFQLKRLLDFNRSKYPDALFCLWASLECTNFSKAKGGKPRDADSRTLAEHLDRYIIALNPDYLWIENVVEFMSWGPLNEKGKPLSRYEGRDFIRWKQHIESLGYRYDHKILNSADYGAHTKRERYFAQFAKDELPIYWPQATHSKVASSDMFGSLKKWRPVKEVLDFKDEGKSIFNRKKDLSEKTLGRIYAGLIKYVAGGEKAFIAKWNSNNPITGINAGCSISEPCHTITTQNRLGIVQPKFITKYYGNGNNNTSVEDPAGTITTVDRMALISSHFLDKQFSGNANHQSIEEPAGAILTNDKHSLITSRFLNKAKKRYLLNPQYSSKGGSVDDPCFTLIARMDKMPPGIVTVKDGNACIIISENDSLYMKKIKEFMCVYGIIDIKMRMLKVKELLKIQGFPNKYFLAGNQCDQKKFIGNSVPPDIPKAMVESYAKFVKKTILKQIAA